MVEQAVMEAPPRVGQATAELRAVGGIDPGLSGVVNLDVAAHDIAVAMASQEQSPASPYVPMFSNYAVTGASSSAAVTVWPRWNQQYVTSVGWLQPKIVWREWNQHYQLLSDSGWVDTNSVTQNYILDSSWGDWNQQYVETQEQRTAREAAAAVAYRARVARDNQAIQERVAAEAKAKKILSEHLSPAQRGELAARGYFHVETGAGTNRRRYRVHGTRTHNVYLLDEHGNVTREFCTVLNDCPLEDQLLLQKLYLESDEPGFYEAANIWDWDVKSKARKTNDTLRVGEKRQAVNRIAEYVKQESGLFVPAK